MSNHTKPSKEEQTKTDTSLRNDQESMVQVIEKKFDLEKENLALKEELKNRSFELFNAQLEIQAKKDYELNLEIHKKKVKECIKIASKHIYGNNKHIFAFMKYRDSLIKTLYRTDLEYEGEYLESGFRTALSEVEKYSLSKVIRRTIEPELLEILENENYGLQELEPIKILGLIRLNTLPSLNFVQFGN